MKSILQNFLLLFSFFIFNCSIYSQVLEEWVNRYNGTSNSLDDPKSMVVDNNGNVYVTGFATNAGTSKDYTTIKYNKNGATEWVRTYNGEAFGGDYSWAIAVDNSGNVYVTGRSDRGGPTLSDYTTIKYNSIGTQQWVAYYNGPGNGLDEAKAIVVDNSGNVFVTGKSLGTTTGQDITTVKYDASGTQQWVMRYNGPSNSEDIGNSIALDQNGNIYVAGGSVGNSYDAVLIKYNPSGVQQWVQRYNGIGNGGDMANMVKLDINNFVYITGYTCIAGTNYDYLTIKYNASGIQQWLQKYEGPAGGMEMANALDIDQSGNVYVTGLSAGLSTGNDYATVKYNSVGVQQWVQRYNGTGNGTDEAYALKLDGVGNIYVGGSSFSGTNMMDFVLIKYKPDGTQSWLQRYNGTGNGDDYTRSIAIDDSNNVYITGQSLGSGTNYDYATLKYYQCILNVNTGNDVTIYIGYGSQTATLTATVTNGREPYHYIWSTNDTTPTITVAPTQTTSYYCIVTDSRTCTDIDTVVVNVVDISCGNNGDHKVLVCHKGNTICIDTNAVRAHLNHGDFLGDCGNQVLTEPTIIKSYKLYRNYPNPFNPVTKIRFDIPTASHVKLVIYDNIGRMVTTLVDGFMQEGTYSYDWNALNYTSGIYFYKIEAGNYSQTMKMVLLK